MASGGGWRSVVEPRWHRGARAIGHLVSAALNLVLLWVAHQLLDWGWPGFLTEDFELLLGILTVSFLLAAATDLVLAVTPDRGVRALVDLARSVVGLVVAVRAWQVFPFDFAGVDGWTVIARIVIAAIAFGSAFGIVDGLVGVVRAALGLAPTDPSAPRDWWGDDQRRPHEPWRDEGPSTADREASEDRSVAGTGSGPPQR